MKLIGVKRVILLAILIALNAAIAASYFLWIEPMREEAQVKLTATKDNISSLQGKIQNTNIELAEYAQNLPRYNELKSSGFMSNQDRFQISRDLDVVRNRAQLSGFSFQIDDLKTIENAEAAAANMTVLNSRINVDNVVSLLDINFYDFVDLMVAEFPSHVRLQNFNISRGDPLNSTTLQRIVAKQPAKLVTGRAVFDWITYVPVASADPTKTPGR